MRIGFICLQNPDDPKNVSGMLYAIKQQLAKRAEVVNVLPERCRGKAQQKRLRSRAKELLPRPILSITRAVSETLRGKSASKVVEPDAGAMLANATRDTQDIQALVNAGDFNVLFACLCKTLLYGLETTIPIVSFSDATARTNNPTSPQKAR